MYKIGCADGTCFRRPNHNLSYTACTLLCSYISSICICFCFALYSIYKDLKIVIFFNYIDYLNFNQSEYGIFEDEGPLCITLTLDKPALFNTTVEVIEVGNGATGKHSTQKFKVWYTKE